MIQCPACASFNDEAASYCSQCGSTLGSRRRRRRRRGGGARKALVWLAGLQGALLALVIAWVYLPEDAGRQDLAGEGTLDGDAAPSAAYVEAEPRGGTVATGADLEVATEPAGPDAAAIERAVANALVVLELDDAEGERLREIRGAVVHPSGAVLCRWKPLLGAYAGSCRLDPDGRTRVPVAGIISYDPARDLALVRVETAGEPLPSVDILEDPPSSVLEAGDRVFVFTDGRGREALVSEPYFATPDGRDGVRLEESPGIRPSAFLAVDAYGYVLGLCRIVSGAVVLDPSQVAVPFRVLVDPARGLAFQVEAPATATLELNTQRFYEGTFADLEERALVAYRSRQWGAAADLLRQALERGSVEGIAGERLDAVNRMLRESYLAELERLQAASRFSEAEALAASGLEVYPRDPAFLFHLATSRGSLGDLRGAIAALLELRAIEGRTRVDPLLEQAYLKLAFDAFERGDERQAELEYLEGIREVSQSGVLRIELARLYERWEAYEDAMRLLEEARRLDDSVRETAQILLEKIDGLLARREALVVPIPEGSSAIRATVVLDDRREATFIIDTGATYTAIPERLARELGYDPDLAEPLLVTTAGGQLRAHRLQLRSVSLGGYTVRNLHAIVLPASSGHDIQLLGLNFLNFFKYSVDSSRREFRLERR